MDCPIDGMLKTVIPNSYSVGIGITVVLAVVGCTMAGEAGTPSQAVVAKAVCETLPAVQNQSSASTARSLNIESIIEARARDSSSNPGTNNRILAVRQCASGPAPRG